MKPLRVFEHPSFPAAHVNLMNGPDRSSVIRVEHLFISPGHNFFGHHGQPAGGHPVVAVEEIECVAGRGIRGDRFFNYKENHKGQITFFAMEVLEALRCELDLPEAQPQATRRNVFVRGADLNALIGEEFRGAGRALCRRGGKQAVLLDELRARSRGGGVVAGSRRAALPDFVRWQIASPELRSTQGGVIVIAGPVVENGIFLCEHSSVGQAASSVLRDRLDGDGAWSAANSPPFGRSRI